MYFIVGFDYEEGKGVHNECIFAQFAQEEEEEAYNYAQWTLPQLKQKYIAILEIPSGEKVYARPNAVFEWSETILAWMHVLPTNPINRVVLTYN